jgi:hypothetical protein
MLVQENGGRKMLDTVRRTRHGTSTTLRGAVLIKGSKMDTGRP